MAKLFFDVFPTLKAEDKVRNMYEDTEVSKVTTTSSRDRLRVYINSTHLIDKRQIWRMERLIKEQLFGRSRVKVQIIENFFLSGQYTPEHLYNSYLDSMIAELRQTSVIGANMLEHAKASFEEGGILCLEMADSIIAQGKKEEIIAFVQYIFAERCHLPVEVRVIYEKKDMSTLKKEKKVKLQQEINAVLDQVTSHIAGEAADTGAGSDPSHGKTAGSAAPKKKEEFAGRRLERTFGGPSGDIIYGRDFEDDATPIEQIIGEIGEIAIRGQIRSVDTREIRNERTIVSFAATDFTDTIVTKLFIANEQLPDILGELKKGSFVKIKGSPMFDRFDHELTMGSIKGIKKIPDFTSTRKDTSVRKRVELHCHTKMSDMDGVSEPKAIAKRAKDWGHPAIAITDHGVVQAFPDVNHYIQDLDKAAQKAYQKEHPDADKEEMKKIHDPFKIIYGVEGYLVDDLTEIAVRAGNQTLEDSYVVFDIETTGFSPVSDKIIEIGAVKVAGGEIVDHFSKFVNPERPIPFEIEKLTSINDDMVMGAPTIEVILPEFLAFCRGSVLVAHNARFDVGFIEQNCRYQDIEERFPYVDTVALARVLMPNLSKYKLNVVAKALGISLENHHRAVDDAGATAEIFLKFIGMLKERGIKTLRGMNQFGNLTPEAIRKLRSFHVIILAKNNTGRVNLYTLISKSHLDYFGRKPLIPKSELNKYREGLIVGSACEAGELYRALLEEKSEEDISRIVDFYDYLEIQPLGNNEFMIESDKHPKIQSLEDIRNLNRKIVALGETHNKPVVGTCDVHFLDPEDEVYRRIIMKGKGFADADRQPPLYLRTTEEMLEEFSYLGSARAEEIVITNTNKIADMIERISPVRPDKCPPVIENSDETLRQICYRKAHATYGEKLPEIVTERLERELNSIISNGFAVMYIIAQKLVWKSNEDGYLVGSRGSVGSSFVATMAGITEVNPLSPHYRCPHCFYSDFDSEEVRAYAGGCGWDMPDKNCPVCGEKMIKDGFDIPFETFLGFYGNKEPDIDLNFSGEYQNNAHRYTEVIFGDGQTYRAGTIATLADKTAYGYVKNYYEEKGQSKRNCEIDRMVSGCTGIRRSTGQHPGGIIVLPVGEDINSFTPVQHPANDMKTDIVTTHFDYHSIDHNLLKLDILGHDDPTMIRMLEDLTGFDPLSIPMDDPGVMSLFADTSALGITPEDIGGCPVGCLGVPEFGTDFVIKMVCDTKPKTLSDLIRISGLSHGTDVWLNNAQTLIEEGKATISSCICTRDDIMTFLINQGVEKGLSFTIMESVRKGKGLKPEWEAVMKEHHVPDWYIWSCKQIKYMFPKAHAAAYVMMAYRIAYFKINYPLAYYAAYFSIRASAFSYELMCQGQDKLKMNLQNLKKNKANWAPKDADTMKDMKIVEEMYARGFEFLPIDLYKSRATKFQIEDGKLLPPFNSIDGVGDNAAEAIEIAAKDGPYLSRDDFRSRTKASTTVIELMNDLGLFGDLPQSNQLSLFDL